MTATEPEAEQDRPSTDDLAEDPFAPSPEPEPEPEVVQGEVVDVDTSGPTVGDTAADDAVEVTILHPGEAPHRGDLVPFGDELHGCAEIAATMAYADNVPKALRGKPAAILAVILTGRELDIAPMTALRCLHVIEGQVTLPPKVRLSIVRQRKLGKVWPDVANNGESATWYAIRADDPETVYASTYTIGNARSVKITSWAGPSDNRHKVVTSLADKDNWQSYPARMLSWRSLGYLMDDAFTEVGTGLYSADELGAVVDEDGNPIIDVQGEPLVAAQVGAQQSQGRGNGGGGQGQARGRQARQPAAPEPASDVQIAEIGAKIEALGEECPAAVTVLRGDWQAEGLPPLKDLPRAKVAMAKALIDKITREAKQGSYDEFEKAAATQARPEPEGPAGEPAEPDQLALPESQLPTEQSASADLQWLADAPREMTELIAEQVKAMEMGDVLATLVEADRKTSGKEMDKRARVCALLVRRAMEAAASVGDGE